MSLQNLNWVVKSQDPSLSILDQLLQNRSVSSLEQLNHQNTLHDPFLFSDMQKALERIQKAIQSNQRIIIFGDYDVDGITGAAILIEAIKSLGGTVSFRLPNREKDGYGLSTNFIEEFKDKNIALLITVDCGISCLQEISLAKQYGIDTIVTDHHHVPEQLPPAYAIIHPLIDKNYPFQGLTGSGVAFKLAQALLQNADHLIELAAMGTISDMGPLTGENRYIVKQGLQKLKTTTRPGLIALKSVSKVHSDSINADTIGFQLGPRINAAGRIGDPYQALFLLLQQDHQNSQKLANLLENYNQDRRARTQFATQQALSYDTNSSVIVQYNPDWHPGILGLIAGRVSEKTGKPAFIMGNKQDQVVGSARCPDYFNVTTALQQLSDLLINFGGHKQAAGFSLPKENLQTFTTKLQNTQINTDQKPTIQIECELPTSHIHNQLLTQINQLRPFGIKNPKPLFLIKNLTPLNVRTLGQDNSHLKFFIEPPHQSTQIPVILFNLGHLASEIQKRQSIDLVAALEFNYFNGNKTLQLRGLDLA